ncbi:MAG TPA: hypothetical protein VKV34_07705 [Thermoleophilia bacterium]|nr:hypothetical protein [Thermoleophilia bacterium]
MRIDQLSLRIEGEPLTLRFHSRMTVVSGLSAEERESMGSLILGALTGQEPRATELSLIDSQGRSLRQIRTPAGQSVCTDPDGKELPPLTVLLGVEASRLRRLSMLVTEDLLPTSTHADRAASDIWHDEPPDLIDARQALAKLQDELDEAQMLRERAEQMRRDLAAVEEEIRRAVDGQAKRRYARLLAELQRVRAEAAALAGGAGGLEGDDRLFEAAEEMRLLARYWQAAERRRQASVKQFGDRVRLSSSELSSALAVPDHMPSGLEALAARLDAAERDRDELAARIADRVAAHLPEPSHPAVIALARHNQDELWAAAAAIERTEQDLEQQSLRLGGVDVAGLTPMLLEEIDDAHRFVESASEVVETRHTTGLIGCTAGIGATVLALATFPLAAPIGLCAAAAAGTWAFVLPRVHETRARRREFVALAQADVPSWLSLHMRRIDPTIDPDSRRPLEEAMRSLRTAHARWSELAGDLDLDTAFRLEAEVRSYSRNLHQQSGLAAEVEELQRRLTEVADPAVALIRHELVEACRPFGIADPSAAVAAVRAQVALAATARLQQELEDAERAEAAAREPVEDRLTELGFDDGTIEARLGGFEWALEAALARSEARSSARPVEEVHADLARLEALARSEARPEWGSDLEPYDGDEPDQEFLRGRREELSDAWRVARRQVPDVELLADRHSALARRVSVLEEQVYGGSRPTEAMDQADIESRLLARVALLRRPTGASPADETAPLVLDDPFQKLHGERKWAVLDLVERLGSQTQIVYLTNDPDVITWARRRVAADAIILLEPVTEPLP